MCRLANHSSPMHGFSHMYVVTCKLTACIFYYNNIRMLDCSVLMCNEAGPTMCICVHMCIANPLPHELVCENAHFNDSCPRLQRGFQCCLLRSTAKVCCLPLTLYSTVSSYCFPSSTPNIVASRKKGLARQTTVMQTAMYIKYEYSMIDGLK